jgi:hypothetical protein
MDYSFTGVNVASVQLAPRHAMQFGSALQCLLQCLVYCNPSFGPPLMAKIDLSDGYYRVPLNPEAALELAVVLPPDNTAQNLIGIPLSLPMDRAQSPPCFCAFTETAADLANTPPCTVHSLHPLAPATQCTPLCPIDTFHAQALLPTHPGTPPSTPLQFVDVYLDDFMALAQRPIHTTFNGSPLTQH